MQYALIFYDLPLILAPMTLVVVVETSQILRVDPVSRTRTLLTDASSANVAFGRIAVEATGDLVVSAFDLPMVCCFAPPRRVIRVHPVSGARSLVFDASTGSGPLPVGPVGLAVEASGTMVMIDTGRRLPTLDVPMGLGAVLRVEPHSGDRAILSR